MQRKLEFQAWTIHSMEELRLLWPGFKLVRLSGCHLGTVCSTNPLKQGLCPSLMPHGSLCFEGPSFKHAHVSPDAECSTDQGQHCLLGGGLRAQIRTHVGPSPLFFSLGHSQLVTLCMESTRCPEELLDLHLWCLLGALGPSTVPGGQSGRQIAPAGWHSTFFFFFFL